ncbi:MAG: hypothetical protein ABI548_25270 [Polyangiaceae bacterium]
MGKRQAVFGAIAAITWTALGTMSCSDSMCDAGAVSHPYGVTCSCINNAVVCTADATGNAGEGGGAPDASDAGFGGTP